VSSVTNELQDVALREGFAEYQATIRRQKEFRTTNPLISMRQFCADLIAKDDRLQPLNAESLRSRFKRIIGGKSLEDKLAPSLDPVVPMGRPKIGMDPLQKFGFIQHTNDHALGAAASRPALAAFNAQIKQQNSGNANRQPPSSLDMQYLAELKLEHPGELIVTQAIPTNAGRHAAVKPPPFVERLRSHPAFASADRAFIAEAAAHPAYCFSSRACVQRWEAMQPCRYPSRGHAQQWDVYGAMIVDNLRQRCTLICRGAVCALLVHKLTHFQGEYGVRNALHHTCCIISRRHFLVSKNAAENLFEEGQRLYGEQRYSEAAKSWGQAALLQHAPSHAFASSLLFDGRADVPKDEQRAFEFACGGVALGCSHSKGALGRCLVYGTGAAKDVAKGLALSRESADAGSSFGQFVVGTCYDTGCGVTHDCAEAVRWFRLAAAQGHALAQCNLGSMVCGGEGVAQDDAEAARWFRLAAAQGDALAQCNLGVMLCRGQGIAQDYTEAVRLYRLAAAQGHAGAQFNLGYMFFNGEGVAQDHAEAVRLYRLAAAQGDAQAQFNVGFMFEKGLGVAQDDAEAVQWFRLAAAQGHPCAATALVRLGA
jgi:TPR repeat protein